MKILIKNLHDVLKEHIFLKDFLEKLGWCASYRLFIRPFPFPKYRWMLIINFPNVSPNRLELYPNDIEYKELVCNCLVCLILKMELVYLSLLKTQKIGYVIKEPIF